MLYDVLYFRQYCPASTVFCCMARHPTSILLTSSLFLFQVKQTSSAIIFEENQRLYGLLGSMGLDNSTVQAFGFSIIVLALAYNLFNPTRNESTRIEIEPSLKDFGPQHEDPSESLRSL